MLKTCDKYSDQIIDGLTIEEFGGLEVDEMCIAQCQVCKRLYSNGHDGRVNLITYDFSMNGDAVCYYCLFYQVYSPSTRTNFDGAFGKFICDFVVECQHTHDPENCPHINACLVCDFIFRRPLPNILKPEKLGDYYPELKEDPLVFEIDI